MKTCIAILMAALALAAGSLPTAQEDSGGSDTTRPPTTRPTSTPMCDTESPQPTPDASTQADVATEAASACVAAAARASAEYRSAVDSGIAVDKFYRPRCTEDGLYARRQCTTGMWTECWCVRPATGEVIEGTRTRPRSGAPVDCDNVDAELRRTTAA